MRTAVTIALTAGGTIAAFGGRSTAAISVPNTNSLVPVASASASAGASAPVDEGPKTRKGCDPNAICFLPWTKRVTIGPGLNAISFRFDRKIALAHRVVPLEIAVSLVQRTYPQFQSSGQYG